MGSWTHAEAHRGHECHQGPAGPRVSQHEHEDLLQHDRRHRSGRPLAALARLELC